MVSVSVPESALVVVGGARFTGREALLYELLASQAGQSAVISTCKTGEKAREQYHDPDETAKRLAVVDCVSVPAGCPEKADEHHLLAAHPTDLTDIGTRTSELFEITNSADGVLAVSNVTATESSPVTPSPAISMGFEVSSVASCPPSSGWLVKFPSHVTTVPTSTMMQLL